LTLKEAFWKSKKTQLITESRKEENLLTREVSQFDQAKAILTLKPTSRKKYS